MKNIVIIACFTITICFSETAQAQASHKFKTLSPKKFEHKMQKPASIVLDVRTLEEFENGHIEDAILMDVQKDDFLQQLSALDKNKTYLIYCRSGKRSEKALKLLSEQGFKKAYHLKGGYLAWKDETIQ